MHDGRRLSYRRSVLVTLTAIVVAAAAGTGIYFLAVGSAGESAEARNFPELFPIGVVGDSGYAQGYIDGSGAVVAEPVFDSASPFSEGFGRVRTRGRGAAYGYVDSTGALVIEPRFNVANDFSDGLALVADEGVWAYIDTTGEVVLSLYEFIDARGFSEGLALVALWDGAASLWGYVDTNGAMAIDPQFGAAHDFSEGLAAVQTEEGWGYIDRTGAVVIGPGYGYAGQFHEDLAAVWELGEGSRMRFGYIDKTGTMVVAPQFSSAGDFHDGLAGVTVATLGRCGFIDTSGEMVIEPRFYSALDFSEGLAAVQSDEGWGYIDRTGEFAIQPRFDWAQSFSPAGLARVAVAHVRAVPSAQAPYQSTGSGPYDEPGIDILDELILQRTAAEAYIDTTGRIVWEGGSE